MAKTDKVEKLEPSVIRHRRAKIDTARHEMELRHAEESKAIALQQRDLERLCPHQDVDGAPYTRWCNDCGATWDTT